MKRFCNLMLPVALMTVAGGGFGLLRSYVYGHSGCYNALMSGETARAFFPFSLFPDKIGAFLELTHTLLVVVAAGLGLWTWTRLGGRELIAAFRKGATKSQARSLFLRSSLGAGCFAFLAAVCSESDLHHYGAVASPWLQLAGLLSFVPAAWALSRQSQMLPLLHSDAATPLSAGEFQLVAALTSPIITSSVLASMIPTSPLHQWLVSESRNVVYIAETVSDGPWVVAAACSALFATAGLGVGLLFGALRSSTALSRRSYQVGGAVMLAAVSQAAYSNPASLVQRPERFVASPSTTCTLVALDTAVEPQRIQYRRAIHSEGLIPTTVSMRRAAQAQARLSLLDWQPEEALRTLADTPDAWFDSFAPILTHLNHARPADLAGILPSQMQALATGYHSCYSATEKRSWLEKADQSPFAVKLQERATHPPTHLASVSGQLQLDGHALGNVRVRLQPVQMENSRTYSSDQEAMKRHLNSEAFLSNSGDNTWSFGIAIQSFYALTSSDGQGRFHLDGIESGDYELVVRLDQVDTVRVSRAPGVIHVGADQALDFSDIELTSSAR